MASQLWQVRRDDPGPDRHSLLGGDWKVKARRHASVDNRQWLNIQLADRRCTYRVLEEDGRLVHEEMGRTKKRHERTAPTLRGSG